MLTNDLTVFDKGAGEAEQASLTDTQIGALAIDNGLEVETRCRSVSSIRVCLRRLDQEGSMKSVP